MRTAVGRHFIKYFQPVVNHLNLLQEQFNCLFSNSWTLEVLLKTSSAQPKPEPISCGLGLASVELFIVQLKISYNFYIVNFWCCCKCITLNSKIFFTNMSRSTFKKGNKGSREGIIPFYTEDAFPSLSKKKDDESSDEESNKRMKAKTIKRLQQGLQERQRLHVPS